MRLPAARQYTAAAVSGRESPLPAYHIAMAPKIAESATRSDVLSRNAPQVLDTPRERAISPSSMSEKTNSVIASAPQKKTPRGKKARAQAETPTVPSTVM